MTITPKDWGEFIRHAVAVSVVVGTMGVWAGDQLWVSRQRLQDVAADFNQQIGQMEINQLDREITFLQIKINQGEATASERIYIETLRQQLRARGLSE